MATITGKVNSGGGAYDSDAAVTAWEALPNIADAKKIGIPGADVADEISNNVAGLRITTDDAAVSDWAAQCAEALDDSETGIDYDTGTGTQPGLPYVIIVGTEKMNVTADSGDGTTGTLTVVRGYDGTTAATALDNAVIDTVVDAGDITDQYGAGDVISGVTFQTAQGEAAPA